MRYVLRRSGFTIVELLVAMAVLAVVLGLLTVLTSSTLRLSSRTIGDSERMLPLRDAVGYMSDSVRRASTVKSSCDLWTADPETQCLDVVVPLLDANEQIVGEERITYRYLPRSDLPGESDLGAAFAPGPDDDDTYAILEYSVTPATDSPMDQQGSLVLDGLDEVGDVFDVGPDEVTLRVRAVSRDRGEVRFTPDPPKTYSVSVQPRNVSP